jgi:rSAM/selenodomain-associated transferase 2
MKISIIIPVYNEEKTIGLLLDYLLKIQNKNTVEEIIVVDGKSLDTTKTIIQSYISVNCLDSKKGRAIQMNTGAKIAKGSILYFLHCDSFPPENFDLQIIKEVQNQNFAGCFKMKFDSNHIVLKVSQWFTQFNFKACRGGDQSLFITKDLFIELNGFNENYTIYEDNELIARIYKASKFVVIQDFIITSSRKYKQNGYWKLQCHFFVIHLMNNLGFNEEKLLHYYKKNIL